MCMKYVEGMYILRLIRSTKNLELKNIGSFKKKSKNMYNTTKNWDWRGNKGKEKEKFKNKSKAIRVHGLPLVLEEALDITKHPLWVQHLNNMLISFYVVM